MMYSEKLRDPRWQKLRLKIFERDGWKCVVCSASDKTLEVHHMRYRRHPWDVPQKYLQTLCSQCHRSKHFKKPEPPDPNALSGEEMRGAFEAMMRALE
jgi:5-methylcytosine-specific restriction endonuclease McrA